MLAGQNIDKFGNSPSFSKNEYVLIHIKVSPCQKFCYIIQHLMHSPDTIHDVLKLIVMSLINSTICYIFYTYITNQLHTEKLKKC